MIVLCQRDSGYRPVWLPPYAAGQAVQVAAVWTRDGCDYRTLHGLTAEEVCRQDGEARKQGYRPADLPGYLDGGRQRYAVLWLKEPGDGAAEIDVGVPEAQQWAAWSARRDAGLTLLVQQTAAGSEGGIRYCYIWRKTGARWFSWIGA